MKQKDQEKRFKRASPEKQEAIKRYRQQQEYLANNFKQCNACGEVKSVASYMTKEGKLLYANCSDCRPQIDKEYFSNNPEKQLNRHSSVYRNREFIANYTQPLKEAGCADCKKYVPDAMEFDHTCPSSEKFYNIADMHTVKGSAENLLKMLEEELTKGEYVCVNCHKIRTTERGNYPRLTYLDDPNDQSLSTISKYVYDLLYKSSCADCDENNFLVLEFDHILGSKKASISYMMRKFNIFSLEDVIEEIGKCEIRCGNCHRVRTIARQLGKEKTQQSPKDVTFTACACGKEKTLGAAMCLECNKIMRRVSTVEKFGDLNILISQLRASNFSSLSRKLGVSDNAIRRHLRRNGINPKTLLPLTD